MKTTEHTRYHQQLKASRIHQQNCILRNYRKSQDQLLTKLGKAKSPVDRHSIQQSLEFVNKRISKLLHESNQ